ncbi:hypothetical protein ACJJTC_013372 [Scirpophaga incertulas]
MRHPAVRYTNKNTSHSSCDTICDSDNAWRRSDKTRTAICHDGGPPTELGTIWDQSMGSVVLALSQRSQWSSTQHKPNPRALRDPKFGWRGRPNLIALMAHICD